MLFFFAVRRKEWATPLRLGANSQRRYAGAIHRADDRAVIVTAPPSTSSIFRFDDEVLLDTRLSGQHNSSTHPSSTSHRRTTRIACRRDRILQAWTTARSLPDAGWHTYRRPSASLALQTAKAVIRSRLHRHLHKIDPARLRRYDDLLDAHGNGPQHDEHQRSRSSYPARRT